MANAENSEADMLLFSGNLSTNGLLSLYRLRGLGSLSSEMKLHGSAEESSSEVEVNMDNVWLVQALCLRKVEAAAQPLAMMTSKPFDMK